MATDLTNLNAAQWAMLDAACRATKYNGSQGDVRTAITRKFGPKTSTFAMRVSAAVIDSQMLLVHGEDRRTWLANVSKEVE